MRHRTVTAALAVILAASAGWAAPQPQEKVSPPEPLTLSLADCIQRALRANPDLAVQVLTPQMDAVRVTQARERFLPQFDLTSFFYRYDFPNTWGLEGPIITSRINDYAFSVTEFLPTSSRITLSLSNRSTDTNRAYPLVNPAYDSEFEARLNQPLLRGFGPKVARHEIVQAGHTLDASTAGLKATLLDTVFNVEQAYWNLYYARQNLLVLHLSLDQARETLKLNREAARIGSRSAIDVLNSETQVASYEDSILSARLQLDSAENLLKSLMGLPSGGAAEAGTPAAALAESAAAAVIPSDTPKPETRAVTLEDALLIAMAERPELAGLQSRIAGAVSDLGYYKNQALPQLDLNFAIWSPGQSGVRFLYPENNPLLPPTGTEVGSRWDSFRDIWRWNYRNWSLFLTFSLPLGDMTSRAGVALARLAREQAVLEMDKERKAIELEVRQAVRELETDARKIESSARYRELAEKRMAAENERYNLGLVSNEWLLQYQAEVARAKAGEVAAIIAYKIALARLEKAMGTTLKTRGLRFRDYDF